MSVTDLIAIKRMNEILKAVDKMHNGLLALIDAHNEFKSATEKRIEDLESEIAVLRDITCRSND